AAISTCCGSAAAALARAAVAKACGAPAHASSGLRPHASASAARIEKAAKVALGRQRLRSCEPTQTSPRLARNRDSIRSTGGAALAQAGSILALDQGTTSSRAIVFQSDLRILGAAQREFAQHYPAPGWVEHEPEDIWRTTVETARQALAGAGLSAADIAGIGITNQRATCLLWDRRTSQPIHRAIVWQDRRTAEACASLKRQGHEPEITARTGLLLDPYFSATKIAWLLDHVEGARALAEA